MPRVTRKQKTVFNTRTVTWWGGILAVVLVGFGTAYFLGTSDTGTIDINGKIRAVDQSASLSPVNVNGNANQPNGGLHAATDQSTPQPPPPPVVESTTTASTTKPVATSTPAAPKTNTKAKAQ